MAPESMYLHLQLGKTEILFLDHCWTDMSLEIMIYPWCCCGVGTNSKNPAVCLNDCSSEITSLALNLQGAQQDSSVVKVPDSWLKGCRFESLQERLFIQENAAVRVFFSRVNFLCWLLFRYPFHPRVTAVAHKRSWSFCPKCRWQVTTYS